jgi:hypothetical protein
MMQRIIKKYPCGAWAPEQSATNGHQSNQIKHGHQGKQLDHRTTSWLPCAAWELLLPCVAGKYKGNERVSTTYTIEMI